jgi:hypothetical protein
MMGGTAARSAPIPIIFARGYDMNRDCCDESDKTDKTKALNLARIVFKLTTDPRGWRVDRLIDELGIADRTYRDYRQTLKEQFEELKDKQRRTLIEEVKDGETRYLRLRDSEDSITDESVFVSRMTALEMARQAFGFLQNTDVGRDIETFRQDIFNRVGDRTYVYRSLTKNLDRKLYYLPHAPKDYSRQGQKLRTVLRGLIGSRVLSIAYDSPTNRLPRLVEPLTLIQWRSALYLVVRSREKKGIYIMAVDRMLEVKSTGQGFHYPPPEVYHPERFTEGGFGIFQQKDGVPTRVELVFANKRPLKLDLTERRWHDTQHTEELPDGRLRMTFTVRTLVEVRPWVRSYGADVEVITPVDLLAQDTNSDTTRKRAAAPRTRKQRNAETVPAPGSPLPDA